MTEPQEPPDVDDRGTEAYAARLALAVSDYLGRRGQTWDEDVFMSLVVARTLNRDDLAEALRAEGVS